MARGLARLRGGGGVAAEDLLDAVRAAYVKGAVGGDGGPVLAAAHKALIGTARGHLPDAAGRPPLIEDFHARVREHRLPLEDDVHEVRLDIEKQAKHRDKSAFLHRCALLGLF